MLDGIPIYPNITQDMQADLIENGDLQIVNFKSCYAGIWADENREEAKDPSYLTKLSKIKELMKVEEYRIIV
ncbi:hypothetical protein CQA37_09905 [Helicobacter sp. MIT 99-10781]|nr:hypothetical protein CQA37_09905 [Helicobacter sp. MIT 99-10781]